MARVLVVDDDDQVRNVLCAALRNAGHQVLQAADGAEAIHLARLAVVDLLVCDLFMPRQGGLATMGKFQRDLPAVPIIAISGVIDPLPIAEGLGDVRALSKPIGVEELLAAVNASLCDE